MANENTAAPTITPFEVVIRSLGCGASTADFILRRMGPKADELPAKYASGDARDWINEHNVPRARQTASPDADVDSSVEDPDVEPFRTDFA